MAGVVLRCLRPRAAAALCSSRALPSPEAGALLIGLGCAPMQSLSGCACECGNNLSATSVNQSGASRISWLSSGARSRSVAMWACRFEGLSLGTARARASAPRSQIMFLLSEVRLRVQRAIASGTDPLPASRRREGAKQAPSLKRRLGKQCLVGRGGLVVWGRYWVWR